MTEEIFFRLYLNQILTRLGPKSTKTTWLIKGYWQQKYLLLHLKEHEKISRLAV
jgi:hypothetical protein